MECRRIQLACTCKIYRQAGRERSRHFDRCRLNHRRHHPIRDGEIATEAKCDSQRLRAKQLVYTGIERTPLCAVASTLPLHGESCPVMAELFATMGDVYIWLGQLPESPQDCELRTNNLRLGGGCVSVGPNGR